MNRVARRVKWWTMAVLCTIAYCTIGAVTARWLEHRWSDFQWGIEGPPAGVVGAFWPIALPILIGDYTASLILGADHE